MTLEDIERVGQIWLEASLIAHDFISTDFWHSNLDTMTQELLPQSESYVHITDENPDAFITVENDFIHCLFVQPEMQHHGIGSLLLSYVKSSHETLRLNVYQQNSSAGKFYESQGFVICGEGACAYTGCAEFEMEWKT